ncbi:MAG: serine/threonine-protein kinase [Deltaproteobacteria bacterium]|jgi:serine/threonine protein kinase|nr:serine/threonine-protein kinase [Deltaproteobacteria bacterium]
MARRYKPKPDCKLPILKLGDMVGEYKIRHYLDSGGMGAVYAGIHPIIKKKVAIKLLHPSVARNPDNIIRFKQEASVVNAIGDPGIVDIFTFGEHTDGRYYFVMEYLRGERLLEFMQRQGSLGGFAAAQLLSMIALSMAAAHDKQVIHRDLKAENIFLCPSSDNRWPPRSKILDFGLAKLSLPINGENLPETKQGITLGTPYYMSPEQCKGKKIDQRSDIYSLGVLAYEMVTGTLPFSHKDPLEIMHMHLRENANLPPSQERNKLFDELILGCLEKNPDNRPQDMREIVTTLETIYPSLNPSWDNQDENYENQDIQVNITTDNLQVKNTDSQNQNKNHNPVPQQDSQADNREQEKTSIINKNNQKEMSRPSIFSIPIFIKKNNSRIMIAFFLSGFLLGLFSGIVLLLLIN